MDAQLTEQVQQWLRWDTNKTTRSEIENLAKTDVAKLRKIMLPRISFGTAGLRAEMGPGFALMNSVTVTQASQGLAKYTAQTVHNAKERGIVIGYDHRHNSRQFADDVARTFAHEGFQIHFLNLVHTPMVPFAISKLNAACGVMITASHNPAKDNGYKVYWENACQIIAPHDAGIAEQIDAHLDIWDTKPVTNLKEVQLFPQYMEEVIKPLTKPTKFLDQLKIVYTPMHGVGLEPALACFEALGIKNNITVVSEQAHADPDFPTVKFPNPEEKGALDLAMALADKIGANIVLSNDPDADRFTAAIREEQWRQLTGDQIGALFTDYILANFSSTTKPNAVVNSTVSSRQMKFQAEQAGAEYYETLTGFKWIGNKAIDLEKQGYNVPFAYEEAIGYMVGGHAIKDKDGISALHVFTQLLAAIFSENRTVSGELERISKATGYYATHNSYYIVSSPEVTVETFAHIRTLPQSKIGDLKVVAWRDLTTGYDSAQPDNKAVLPVSKSSEMLTVELEFPTGEKARFTARGSGTEPKLKVYIEASAGSEKQAQWAADKVWDTLAYEWFAKIK